MSELLTRCRKRLADGVTIWCDWDEDVPALVDALAKADADQAVKESRNPELDAALEELGGEIQEGLAWIARKLSDFGKTVIP